MWSCKGRKQKKIKGIIACIHLDKNMALKGHDSKAKELQLNAKSPHMLLASSRLAIYLPSFSLQSQMSI